MLVRYLRWKTSGSYSPAIDPEDVAQSVFAAVHRGLQSHRFKSLGGRKAFWALLIVIGMRKAKNRQRDASTYQRHLENSRVLALDIQEPASPESWFEEEIDHLLQVLHKEDPNGRLKEIVSLKLKGLNNLQIAKTLGCSRKTVALRLNLVFEIWKQEAQV